MPGDTVLAASAPALADWKLRVTEIFYSLQGETSRVGLPTVFIRLTGCPLRCLYCDTAYAFHGGDTRTIQDVIDEAATYATPYVTVTGGDLANFNGVVGLDLKGTQNITDLPGNALPTTEPSTDETYSVDNAAPGLTSFTRQTPATSSTDADTLVFRALFSEAVINVTTDDFAVNGTTTATVTNVATVNSSTYDVTVTGGNLASFNGVVGLDLKGTQNITDLAGNALPTTEPSTDETYAVDNANPGVSTILRADPNFTSASSVNFTVTFTESVTAVDAGDFALHTVGIAGSSLTNVSGSGAIYTVTVNTGFGNGTLRLDLVDNDSIQDVGAFPLGGAGVGNGSFTSGEVYAVNKGADTTGVFRPGNGLLYLKNKNETGFADAALNYGLPGDYPVVGDWDGNGTVTIGIYRNGTFFLRNSNTLGFAEIVFPFGQVGDQPIAGDWDGDGVDTIGIYRPSNGQFLLRNSNTEGPAEANFILGNVGDVGIAGDWNGDGKDSTGVFRPSNGVIFLKDTNDTGFADYTLNYGLPGDMPVTGDWDNNGTDTIGIYRNGEFFLRNENTNGFAEIVFGLGNPGDMPIAGNWDGLP